MTTEQYQIGYEAGYSDGFDALAHPQPTTPAVKDSLIAQELEARQGGVRYEKLRKLSPRQFDELYARNLKGEFFDDMVDSLPEPSTPKPWEFSAPGQALCVNCAPEGRCMKRQALCNAKLGVNQGQCGAPEQSGKEGV